jgi:hypothetical protein
MLGVEGERLRDPPADGRNDADRDVAADKPSQRVRVTFDPRPLLD